MLKRVGRGCSAVAVAMWILVACSSDPAATTPTPAPYASCRVGESCACFTGYSGKRTCPNPNDLSDPGLCDCGTCEPLPTPTPREFTPCGGEPFGTWVSTEIDLTNTFFQITNRDGYLLAACQAVFAPKQLEIRFDIKNDVATVWNRASEVDIEFMPQCLEGRQTNCSLVDGCAYAACGRCACNTKRDSLRTDGPWSRKDNKITLPGYGAPVDYCIKGGRMQIRDAVGTLATFKRFIGSGAPLACRDRYSKDCLGGGCSLGACSGTGDCASAGTETVCTSRQGCAWDPKQCTGNASLACDFTEFGIVPGCAL